MNNKCKECGAESNLEYNVGVCYLCGHDNKGEEVLIGIDMGSPVGSFSALPHARETMTINSYGRLQEVYKDEWMKEFNKKRCFGTNTLRNSTK